MKNEYVIYWRQEILYRSKVISLSEEQAKKDFITMKENDNFSDDIDWEEDDNFKFEIDSIECIEKEVE